MVFKMSFFITETLDICANRQRLLLTYTETGGGKSFYAEAIQDRTNKYQSRKETELMNDVFNT